jgi:YoeB-like toxin of type II toxin-antitoxin system
MIYGVSDRTSYWSRRIDREHRLVYKLHDDELYIAQCRYHPDVILSPISFVASIGSTE